jgi:hypothetical protein
MYANRTSAFVKWNIEQVLTRHWNGQKFSKVERSTFSCNNIQRLRRMLFISTNSELRRVFRLSSRLWWQSPRNMRLPSSGFWEMLVYIHTTAWYKTQKTTIWTFTGVRNLKTYREILVNPGGKTFLYDWECCNRDKMTERVEMET